MRKIVSYMLVVIWMGFIFYMSSRTGDESGQMSGFFVDQLLRITDGNEQMYGVTEVIVRKGAHMTEYAILYLLIYMTPYMKEQRKFFPRKEIRLRVFAGSLFFCFLYAVSDECHQLLVSDRAGRVTDVFIDIAGAAIAMVCILLFRWRRNKKT